MKFTIAGPRGKEMENLQKEFDSYIKKHGLTTEAVLAAYADKSIKNLSSLVCLVEFHGKTILLTGDARGDHVLAGLGEAGLLDADGAIRVDVLKVPHHGSQHNVTPEFFEKVIADIYVFSGDGKYGNPERSTIEWLVSACGANPVTIILTYETDPVDTKRRLDSEEHGKNWEHSRDSLGAFFTSLAHSHPHVKILTGAPVKINLGEDKVTW